MIRTLALASTALILLAGCNPQQAEPAKTDAASAPATPGVGGAPHHLGDTGRGLALALVDGTTLQAVALFQQVTLGI